MAAKLWKLITTRECARMLGLVVTAPERDRDLKDAAKAMEIDKVLSEANGLYDGALEELLAQAQKCDDSEASDRHQPRERSPAIVIVHTIAGVSCSNGIACHGVNWRSQILERRYLSETAQAVVVQFRTARSAVYRGDERDIPNESG